MGYVKDALLGFATADALGVPIEFTKRNQGEPLKEMVGFGSHPVPEGTWSDDTSMTIAAMDSIIDKKGIDYNDIMKRFLQWIQSAKYTATDEVFDMGIATRNALANFAYSNAEPTECGVKGFNENGNGSLMRILPFVFYAYENNMSEEEVTKFINDASSLTHAHEISRLGCKIYTDYVFELLNGKDKIQALSELQDIDYSKYYSQESIDYYKRILDGSIVNEPVDKIKSSGFVVDTLEAAIWCTINNDSYEDAVVKAINLGNDTDTVGAVTGSLNGLIYGAENIPNRWLKKLRKKDYLEKLSMNFEKTLNTSIGKNK